MSRAREDLPDALDLIASWIRDLAVARHAPESLIHHDRRDEILAAAHRSGRVLFRKGRGGAGKTSSARFQANTRPGWNGC